MKSKLFLHVGPHKTGTTTLQHFFANNRSSLLSAGIVYPLTEQSHWKLAAKLGLKMWPWTFDEQTPSWEDVAKISAEHADKHLLISSESFSYAALPAKKDAAKKLFKHLKALGRDIQVILYLRRQDLWVESYYIEYLKHLGLGGINDLLEVRQDNLDYYRVVSFWASLAGKENVIVRVYERQQLPNILQDFLQILGIGNNVSFQPNADQNHRPSLLQMQVLKNYVDAFHDTFPSPDNDFNKPYGALNSTLGGFLYLTSQWPSVHEYKLLPFQKAKEIMEACEASNARVAKEFLGRVDGKLFFEELMPYEHDLLHFPHTLDQAQIDVISSLWEKTCDLMNLPATTFPPLEIDNQAPLVASFTGERFIPETDDFKISYEHWHRYLYAVHFSAGKKVLDIACGEGYGAYVLSENAEMVTGVDIDEEIIQEAAIKYKRSNLNYLAGSVDRIPIKGEAVFDLIVSFETIEHVEAELQASFLLEVKRLLKPDGIFIVSTPDKLVYTDLPHYKNEFHIKEFYKDEFKAFLTNYFAHVELLGQDIYTSSYIRQPDGGGGFSEYNLSHRHFFQPQSAEYIGDKYLLAVCSAQRLSALPASILYNSENKRAEYDLTYQALYIDSGNGFNESEVLLSKILDKNRLFPFDLSGFPDVKKFRFDPAACPIYLKINAITFETKDGQKVEAIFSTNAVEIDDPYYIFDTNDPQVFFDIPFSGSFESVFFDLEYLATGPAVFPYLKNNVEQKIRESNARIKSLTMALKRQEAEIGNLSKDLQTNKLLLDKAEQQIALQKRYNEWMDAYIADQKVATGNLNQRLVLAAEQLEQQQQLNEQKERKIAEQEAVINALNLRIVKVELTINQKVERIGNLTNSLRSAVESVKTLESALVARGEELKNRDSQIQSLLLNAQTNIQTIESLWANVAQKEKIIETQHNKLRNHLEELKAAKENLTSLEQTRIDLESRLTVAQGENTALKNETRRLKNDLEENRHILNGLALQTAELNRKIDGLENNLHTKDDNYARLERDNLAKTKYIGELRASLSFRIGWALTAPFRWAYDTLNVSFWGEFLRTGAKHPENFFKNVTLNKVGVLWKALKNEPPSLILNNLEKLLSGKSTTLVLSPKPVQPPTNVEHLEVKAEPSEERKVHYFIDQLTELDFHISIRGWLFAEAHEIEKVSINIRQAEKAFTYPLFYRIDRMDVFNHYMNRNAIRSGFSDSVEKPFTGKVHVRLIVAFADGVQTKLDLGETELREPFLSAFDEAIRLNRSAFLTQRRNQKGKGKTIGIYTNSKGNYFFNEIKKLVANGFQSLGFETLELDETDGFNNEALLHIVIAPHEFFTLGEGKNFVKKPSDRMILFNTEQPSSEWFSKGTAYFSYALEVWDMNYYAWQCLQKYIGYARFLPLGFAKNFDLLGEVRQLPENYCTCFLEQKVKKNSFLHKRFEDRPIDILFVGHASPRRQQFFAKYAAFFAKYNCYFYLTDLSLGPVLDTEKNMNTRTAIGLAQRSKIILNIHHGTHQYFEWHRMVMHGIWQRGLVISEPCSDGPPFEAGKDFILAPLDELPERIQYFLETSSGRKKANKIIEQAYNTLTTKCQLSDVLREIAEPLFEKQQLQLSL